MRKKRVNKRKIKIVLGGVPVRLRLNLCDVDVQLKINGWRESNPDEEMGDNWCDVKLSLNSKYLNYDPSGEMLTSGEILDLEEILGQLLEGTLEKDCTVKFIEPDLQFNLRIAKRLYDVPGKIIYRNGYVDVDIEADFVIHFWFSWGLESNAFNMYMDRQEINALYTYLRFVTGKIALDDTDIVSLIQKGMLLPE